MFRAINVGRSRCRVAKSHLYGQASSFLKFISACHFASSSSSTRLHFGALKPLRWDDVHSDCFDLASQLQTVQIHVSKAFKLALFPHLRDCK